MEHVATVAPETLDKMVLNSLDRFINLAENSNLTTGANEDLQSIIDEVTQLSKKYRENRIIAN